MFNLFKTPEQKQEEFIKTIENSRGWDRNFYLHYNYIAEHKVFRVEITDFNNGPKPLPNMWKIKVYHFDRPSKILFRTSSKRHGSHIERGLAEAHAYCWEEYNRWREYNGYPPYEAPNEQNTFRIASAG